MVENVLAEAWVRQKLLADPTLAAMSTEVFNEVEDNDTTGVWVVMSHRGSRDVMYSGGHRTLVECIYLVEARGLIADYNTVEDMANRVDDVLHDTRGTITVTRPGVTQTGSVLSCVRTNPFKRKEEADGKIYIRLGGEYRIEVHAA